MSTFIVFYGAYSQESVVRGRKGIEEAPGVGEQNRQEGGGSPPGCPGKESDAGGEDDAPSSQDWKTRKT